MKITFNPKGTSIETAYSEKKTLLKGAILGYWKSVILLLHFLFGAAISGLLVYGLKTKEIIVKKEGWEVVFMVFGTITCVRLIYLYVKESENRLKLLEKVNLQRKELAEVVKNFIKEKNTAA